MPIIDGNEVFAYLRVCQDEATLQEVAALCGERMDLMTKQPDNARKALPGMGEYVHEQSHTAGGSSQPVLTGPSPGNAFGTTTAEQAAINTAILEEQTSQGRNLGQQISAVVLEGGGQPPTPSESLLKAAVERGEDPLVASAEIRQGQGGNLGVLPPATEATEAARTGNGGKSAGGGAKEGKAKEGTDTSANPGHSAKK